MEQEVDFINASVILKELELKLVQYDETTLAQKQSEAHKEIEDHFEKCLAALALRKDTLLREVDFKYQEKKNKIDGNQERVKDSIIACKKLMEAGLTMYKHQRSAAVHYWKGTAELKWEQEKQSIVKVKFSDTLLATIENHGDVFVEVPIVPFTRASAVSTFAGTTDGHVDGDAVTSQFNSPLGVALNPEDNCLYVSDSSNNMIRKITMQGEVTTFAGKKKDGPFHYPAGIHYCKSTQCFFVASQNHTINKISAKGVVSVFVGSGKEGCEDGQGEKASFKHPTGVAIDQKTGNLYVTDCGNNSIRKVTPEGLVVTLLGPGKPGNFEGTVGQLNNPYGLCFYEKEHSLLICDYGNNRLLKMPLDGKGKITTICEVTRPSCVAVTSSGPFLVTAQNKILKLTLNPTSGKYDIDTLAGTNKHGSADGTPLESSFNHPTGMAVCEELKVCYVADHLNSRIRKITLI